MTFSIDRPTVEREMRVVRSSLYSGLRPYLTEAVEALRAARSLPDMVECQRRLFEQFLVYQDAQVELRGERASVVARRSHLARSPSPKPIDELRQLNGQIDELDDRDRALSAALHALRQVGDGIAWVALGFDRRAITVLGEGNRVGRLTSGRGLEAEIAELDRFWHDEGRFAVYNDLTNCLRIGDLTVLPAERGRPIEIAEVKAGRNRGGRQEQRLRARLEFLNEGRRGTGADAAVIPTAGPPLRLFTRALREAISTARRNGQAHSRPHRCLAISVANYHVGDAKLAQLAGWETAGPIDLGWDVASPRYVRSLTTVRRMQAQREVSAFVAPLTIFPLPASDIADLILGMLDVCTTIDCDGLEREFRGLGISADVYGSDRTAAGTFLAAARGRERITVPGVLRTQMFSELLSPATLVRAVNVALLNSSLSRETLPPSQLLTYRAERAAWAWGTDA